MTWYEYKWFEVKIYSLLLVPSHSWFLIPPNLAMAIGGVRTHSYDCPPHTEYVKQLLYVWSESGISMKWMRGPNHYHYITVLHVKNQHHHHQTCHSGSYQWSKDILIWLPPDTFYMYEVNLVRVWRGWSQSYPTACPQWETTTKSYNPAHPF